MIFYQLLSILHIGVCIASTSSNGEYGIDSPFHLVELIHNPHAISASRWGKEETEHTDIPLTNHSVIKHASSFQDQRIEEAFQIQKELTEEWNERRRIRRLGETAPLTESESTAPLFEGIGTHYAYIYVGTPPQRVTVIVDTGSHHTAFPCSGCSNCGKHTDPYYEAKKSSSNKILPCSQCKGGARCSNSKCEFSQSYTEGSSWKAVQMEDLMWVGGLAANEQPVAGTGKALAVPFLFGCQYSETGLFRTQKADGIMGLSINSLTMVPTLVAHHLLPVKTFSLCFSRTGHPFEFGFGGMMMIGGADTATLSEPIRFIPLSKKSSWFTVHLYDIRIQSHNKSDKGSIGVKDSVLNSGKGVIVDSGTTDTYLPRALASQFKTAFKKAAKRDYSNSRMTLNDKDFAAFPDVVFVFKDNDNEEVLVRVKPSAYMEKQGSDRYVPRIYLTEGSGAVLGANFMQDQMVVFDEQNSRVGIGRANCEYKNYIQLDKPPPSNGSTSTSSAENSLESSLLDHLSNHSSLSTIYDAYSEPQSTTQQAIDQTVLSPNLFDIFMVSFFASTVFLGLFQIYRTYSSKPAVTFSDDDEM